MVVAGTGAAPTPCARRVCRLRDAWRDARVYRPGTHRDEREGAARVDRDAPGACELGATADAVAGASGAASERGGRPGGNVDTADATVVGVLRCIRGAMVSEEPVSGVWCHRKGSALQPGACAVCGMARRGGAGQARTPTSAKVPSGAIAMPTGWLNWALAPTPSLEPWVPPAIVVVAPVAMSTRRIRWLELSCDAS